MTLKEYSAAIAGMRKLVPPTHQEEHRKNLTHTPSEELHQQQQQGLTTAPLTKANAY